MSSSGQYGGHVARQLTASFDSPSGIGTTPLEGGYAARILRFWPGMSVTGGSRRGRLFHDRGLFAALFAGDDP